MVRVSNWIVAALNFVILGLAMVALGYSSWLYVNSRSPCDRTLRAPLMAIGVALLAVSMAGILGSCCGLSFFMWLYLVTLFALIVGLTAFTIFGVIVTHGRIGKTGELHSSQWLRNHVLDAGNWDKIRMCLGQMEFCDGVGNGEEYSSKHRLSPITLGCCKPPANCEHRPVPDADTPAGLNPDCKMWSDDLTEMCFSCNSCKEAVLVNIRRQWGTLTIGNTGLVILVSIIYFISCCAMRNNQRQGYTRFRNESP